MKKGEGVRRGPDSVIPGLKTRNPEVRIKIIYKSRHPEI